MLFINVVGIRVCIVPTIIFMLILFQLIRRYQIFTQTHTETIGDILTVTKGIIGWIGGWVFTWFMWNMFYTNIFLICVVDIVYGIVAPIFVVVVESEISRNHLSNL